MTAWTSTFLTHNMHQGFICPVCRSPLQQEEKRYRCPKGHMFDRASSGYVNLAMNQSSSAKRHGDDKRMIRARTEFLSTGAYRCLSDKLVDLSSALLADGESFLDAGCGEGHYTALLAQRLSEEKKQCTLMGIDVSKEALTAAEKRRAGLLLAVASVFHLPVEDGSVSLVWNVFAPAAGEEYARVLRPGGHLIRVFPLEEHLMGLKERIYETVYPNQPKEPEFEGLTLLETHFLRETLTLHSASEIAALFAMTPYYYKTSAADQEKIVGAETLTTPIAFGISVYRKQ